MSGETKIIGGTGSEKPGRVASFNPEHKPQKIVRRYTGKALLAVLLTWMLLFLAALQLIRTYGSKNFPQNDEVWALYDAGPGVHLSWLWKPWAEHRIPLAKLIWETVLECTGYNFQAGDFLTVLALATTTLALIWCARLIRGRTILADAFFPLALLNFGQAQVFLWWWQVNHVLAPVIVIALLLLILRRAKDLSVRDAEVIAAALILLALCGPGGLPYVLSLAAWLVCWVATARPRQYGGLLVLTAAAVALVGFYFVNYTPYFPENDPTSIIAFPRSPGLSATAIACLQIAGLSLGTATKSHAVLWGFGAVALGLAAAATLIGLSLREKRERLRALGLLAILGASAVVVGATANSRAAMGLDYIYQGHYLTPLAPALCAMFFAWEMCGGPFARIIQYGLVGILLALLPLNVKQALVTGNDLQAKSTAFEHDVARGVPAFVLAERHFSSDVVPRPDKLTTILLEHKKNGIGIFKDIHDAPPLHSSTLALETASLDGLVQHNAILDGAGSLTFTLPKPEHVYAVRLRYHYIRTQNAWCTMRVYWRNSIAEDFTDARAQFSTASGPDQPHWALIDGIIRVDAKVRNDRTLTVWIDGIIDQVRIYPDTASAESKLSDIELLQ